MQKRFIKFKLYPNRKQEALLSVWLDLHRTLYNAALEQRLFAWRQSKRKIGYAEQVNSLPKIKALFPDYQNLGDQALQATLHKVASACNKFYLAPSKGFPYFKSKMHFKKIAYLHPYFKIRKINKRLWRVSIPNLGHLRARGQPRIDVNFGKVESITLSNKMDDCWELVLAVAYNESLFKRKAAPNNTELHLDIGFTDNIATSNSYAINYPDAIMDLQKKENELIKKLPRHMPITCKEKATFKKYLCVHKAMRRKRHDLIHQLSAVFATHYKKITIDYCKYYNKDKRYKDFITTSNMLLCHMLDYKSIEAGGQCDQKSVTGQGLAKMPKNQA